MKMDEGDMGYGRAARKWREKQTRQGLWRGEEALMGRLRG